MNESLANFSLSTVNEKWLQAQIAGGGFSTRSEVVNYLINLAREREGVRMRLIEAEQSVLDHGWVTDTPQQILDSFKETARQNGKL